MQYVKYREVGAYRIYLAPTVGRLNDMLRLERAVKDFLESGEMSSGSRLYTLLYRHLNEREVAELYDLAAQTGMARFEDILTWLRQRPHGRAETDEVLATLWDIECTQYLMKTLAAGKSLTTWDLQVAKLAVRIE